jgi:SAM-dependent methyltransferase
MEPGDVARFYDAVADAYAEHLFGELAHKPLDRARIDRLAALTRGRGPICDLRCGPGQVARYLRDRGAPVFGADISEAMLREARRRSPRIAFQRHDMLALGLRSGALGGVAAFYAVVHFSLEQLACMLGEVARARAGRLPPAGPPRRRGAPPGRRALRAGGLGRVPVLPGRRRGARRPPARRAADRAAWSSSRRRCASHTRRSRSRPAASTCSPAGLAEVAATCAAALSLPPLALRPSASRKGQPSQPAR